MKESLISKLSYYSFLAAGSAALLGSIYYLYSTYKDSQLNTDSDYSSINTSFSTKQESEEESKLNKINKNYIELKNKKDLIPIEILVLISREVEQELEIEENYLRKQRITVLNILKLTTNYDEKLNLEERYNDLVIKGYKDRYKHFDDAKRRYELLYKNKIDNFNNIFSSIGSLKSEKLLYSIYKPNFYNIFASIGETREAIIFHCSSIIQNYSNINFSNKDNEKLALLTTRSKIDDELYIKYQLSPSQLMFLVYFYNLDEEKEVKESLVSVGRV